MIGGDTIVALSSGALPAGVAVIRLSGPRVQEYVTRFTGTLPEPRRLTLRPLGEGEVLDHGLVAFFPAPHSFTGEDCAEFHVHGSRAGVRVILQRLVAAGGRLAEAGEFTRRALDNGKLDLVTIEGLGDLLDADTESQRLQALARSEGGLSRKIEGWRETLLDLRAELEARLDFSDEGDVTDLPATFATAVENLLQDLTTVLRTYDQGRMVRDGIRVALAGAPNVGKSSLINALAGSDIAIVTAEAGTTRDVREVSLDINGQLFVLLDLAGLRETDSLAEAEGVRRAEAAIAEADLVLWLTAPDVPDIPHPVFDGPVYNIVNKVDLLSAVPSSLAISAQQGTGMDTLRSKLGEFAQSFQSGEPVLISRERDRFALEAATSGLQTTLATLDTPELAAEGLRQASHALERLIGRVDAEHVLDQLFASFCIGK